MQGLHLTADLYDCRVGSGLMADAEVLQRCCLDAVAQAGLRPVGRLFHAFAAPGGVTGMVLLAESHLAVHTWPELNAVTLDVYVCNLEADNSARAQRLIDTLEALFAATSAERHRVRRGAPVGA